MYHTNDNNAFLEVMAVLVFIVPIFLTLFFTFFIGGLCNKRLYVFIGSTIALSIPAYLLFHDCFYQGWGLSYTNTLIGYILYALLFYSLTFFFFWLEQRSQIKKKARRHQFKA